MRYDANFFAQFRIVRGADGHRYIYDPHGIIPAFHTHIPQRRQILYRRWRHPQSYTPSDRHVWDRRHSELYAEPVSNGSLNGLGDFGVQQGVGLASTALNFIPGVGPILGSVVGMLGGLFGGGGPPIGPLWQQIISLRISIADLNNHLGHPDSFTFTGDASNPDTGGVEAAVITSQVLGKSVGTDPETLRHIIKREDEESALSALQSEYQQLQGAAGVQNQNDHDSQLIQEFIAAQGGQGTASSPIVPGAGTVPPPGYAAPGAMQATPPGSDPATPYPPQGATPPEAMTAGFSLSQDWPIIAAVGLLGFGLLMPSQGGKR